jgi:hypothetical protein
LEQYQFLREHDIHCEMFRLHLMVGNLDESHKSLLAAFDTVDKIVPEVIEMQSPRLEQFVASSARNNPTLAPCEWRGRDDDYGEGGTGGGGGGGARNNFSAAYRERQASLKKYRREPRRVVGDQARVRMYTLFFAHDTFVALLVTSRISTLSWSAIILIPLHVYLFSDRKPYQESKLTANEQLLRLSAGPLCEAHIVVLHELMRAVPQREEQQHAQLAHHLGLRYAQKNDYSSSHKYFEVQDDCFSCEF